MVLLTGALLGLKDLFVSTRTHTGQGYVWSSKRNMNTSSKTYSTSSSTGRELKIGADYASTAMQVQQE